MAVPLFSSLRDAPREVYEGETAVLYSSTAKGFLYSDIPCSYFSHVSIQKVESDCVRDPFLPNLQFAAFELQSVKTNDEQRPFRTRFKRNLVFGRKVKLFHIASKKYLYVPDVSDTDKSPVAVLKDEDSLERDYFSTFPADPRILFKILPGKSDKHRGEDVTQEDTIRLQSVLDLERGNHLYGSYNTLTNKYELKLGTIYTPFTLYAHTGFEDTLSTKALKAGEPFMMLNVDHEAFASASGSVACESLPPELKKEYEKGFSVVARTRRTAQGTQKPLPTSGDAFWQIEKLSNPLSGGQLQYLEKCRVKHLLTQKYLAIVNVDVNGKQQQMVTLKSLSPDRDYSEISFTLTPIIKQRTGGLNKGSYVELRHTETGLAVGVRAIAQLVRSLSISDQESSSSLQYKIVAMETEASRQTVFKLEEVHDSLTKEFYYVTSVVFLLSNHMQKLMKGQHSLLQELMNTLEHVSEWLTSIQLSKNRVNMIRATKMVDLLMGFLMLVENTTQDSTWINLCKQICEVIVKYLENSNYKSLAYLAKDEFLDILLDKVGLNMGVEAVLQALIQDNTKLGEEIVEKLLTIERSARDLLKKLDVAILNFFSTLCFTGGKPVRSLQNSILQFVLESGAEQLLRTEVQEDGIVFVFPEQFQGKKLSEIASPDESDLDKEVFELFLAQIKLFSQICKGGNEEAKSKIVDQEKYITFEEALLCLKDEGIHPKLQSYYLDFVMSAFVQTAVESSGTDIENIWRCYAWPALNPAPEDELEDCVDFTVYNDEIQELKTIIRQHLKGTTSLDTDNVGKSELMLNMLRLMKLLVAYGYYLVKDSVRPVITLLIDIIDAEHTVIEDNPGNMVAFAVKSEAIRILHLLFKQYTYIVVGRFIYNYKAVMEGESHPLAGYCLNMEEDRKALTRLISPGFQPDENPSVTAVCRRLLYSHFDDRCYQAMNIFYQDDGESDDGESSDDRSSNSSDDHIRSPLVQILVKLLQYRNDELRMTSARLLFDMHKRESILFSNALDSYICTKPSFSSFGELVTLGSLSDEDKLLVKMHTGKLGSLRQTLLETLEKMSSSCLLEDDPAEPNPSYQGIAYSTRMFNQLLYFVLRQHTIADNPDKDIIEKACDVLINCTHKNPTVQENVYQSSLELLNTKVAVNSFVRLFTEVLTDNAANCRKLSEEELRQIFQLATSSVNPDHFELCVTLQAAIKVSKTSPIMIRSNQEFVAKLFEKHPVDVKSLKDPSQESESSQTLLMNAVDLLSVCAEREGESARNYAHRLYSMEDLLSLIFNKDIPLPYRKPYAHLLTEAFINDRIESSCDLLAKESEFWKHVNDCAELLTTVSKTEEENKTRIALKILATSHMSIREWERMTCDLDIPIAEGVSLGGALLYLFEGIIPLVTALCEEFERLCNSGPACKIYASLLEGEEVNKYLWEFAKSIQCIANKATVFATSNAQVALLTNCLRALSYCIKDEHQTDALKEDRRKLLTTFQQQELMSDSKKKYDAIFGKEEILNEDFKIFVQNYQRAYGGKVTADNDYVGAGVVLPQGPSFRLLVRQFSDIADEEMISFWKSLFGDTNVVEGEEFHLDSADALRTLLDILSRQLEQRLSIQERKELDEMLLTCLQLFTALVENHVASINRNLQKTNPEKFQKDIDAEVKPVQKRLLDLKVHDKVILHLDHTRNEVTVHVLAVLSMLLHFGNEQAQQEIGRLVRQHHMQMFSRMHKILTTASSALLGERPDVVQFKQLRGLRMQKPLEVGGLEIAQQKSAAEEQIAAAEEAYISQLKDAPKDPDEAGAISIPMEPLQLGLQPEDLEDVDSPGGATAIKEEDIATDNDKEKDTARQEKTSDGSEPGSDDDSIFWDDDDNDSNVDIVEESGEVKIDVTKLSEVQNVSVVLDVIAWICDGQNEKMQKVLREQDIHLDSFNIVGQVAILLLGLSDKLNPRTMRLAKGALQALIEMCAGNYLNQEAAFKGQVTDSVMKILSHGEMELLLDEPIPEETIPLMRMKASAVELLEVLLEETDELSSELAQGISQDVDIYQLKLFMDQLWQLQNKWDETLKEQLRDEARKAMYRAFHVVRKMANYRGLSWKELISDELGYSSEEYRHDMWKHLCEWSHGVEIDFQPVEGKSILTKVYFPFDPKQRLSESEKTVMNTRLKRDAPADKLTDLLDWITSIRENVDYKRALREKWYFRLALSLSDLRHWILVLLTIVMNLFTIFLLGAPDEIEDGSGSSDDNNSTSNGSSTGRGIEFVFPPSAPDWYANYVLYIGGSFHLVLSMWMVLEYFIRTWPDIRFYLFSTITYRVKKVFSRNKRTQAMFKCLCCCCALCYKGNVIQNLRPPKNLHGFQIDFISFNPLYRLVFLACSITALGTSGYFYCGCLIYAFMRNNVLLVVLSAIRRSAAQLFSVFVLIFVIVYIYAVISFVFLHEFFDVNDGLFCRTLGECVVTVIREGLLDTLGAGIPLTVPDIEPSFTVLVWRLLLDVSFAIIVTILALNIVVAILVDRFSAIREEKEKILEDQQGQCFICAIDNDSFERKGKGFWRHVHEDHNMWSYLYFVLYLDTLFENDRNALEAYVYKHVIPDKLNINFFPLHKAKVLPNNGLNIKEN